VTGPTYDNRGRTTDAAVRYHEQTAAKRGGKMPAIDSEDDRPKKKIIHEIGQDLALLSVGELSERINLLKDEIGRLEAEISRKRASQNAANAIFKK
jgi:uncharacterized small protein (DUF1192 family)